MQPEQKYSLSDCELETLRRASSHRKMAFEADRRDYLGSELMTYGLVREGYTRAELHAIGGKAQKVGSFDELAQVAQEKLILDTPFGSGIKKFQLPVDMMPIRVAKTIFPPGSKVSAHFHPENEPSNPGGGLRMVASGEVYHEDKIYRSGDWFFVPNGQNYEFSTSPDVPTEVFYTYAFFAAAEGNRFSHPEKA